MVGGDASHCELEVPAGAELRVDVPPSDAGDVSLQVVRGEAEVFGAELRPHRLYTYPAAGGCKLAAFTWTGCTLRLTHSGADASSYSYIANETPMSMYACTHSALEQMRDAAGASKSRGPCLMVVGATDSGKSSLCKLLLNYAVRQGRRPVFVDVDVGQGEVALPGTVAALPVDAMSDPVEGYGVDGPLVYNFTHLTPDRNTLLYETLISRLGKVVNMKCREDTGVAASGIIINTCGWITGYGYRAILHVARVFEVDVVIALDNEQLFEELERDLPRFVKVVLQPKSGGVVKRAHTHRVQSRQRRIREYFYGLRDNLHPATYDIACSQLKVYEIVVDGGGALSVKGRDTRDTTLVNSVMSVSLADHVDENIVETNAAGFIIILDVDVAADTITVLAPTPQPLPSDILILSTVKYHGHEKPRE